MSKLIYLDNSDFSDLSAPSNRLSAQNKNVLDFLLAKKNSGDRFFLSPVLLSEGVHAALSNKEFAVQRAKVMRDLCQSNFLIYPTNICELEIRKAISGECPVLTLQEITSREDEWFGVATDYLSHSGKRDLQAEIDKYFETLPRNARRRMRSILSFSKKSSHPHWRKLLREGEALSASNVPLPLSMISRDIVIDWFLGIRTDDEFRYELVKTMKDPYVLFSYVLDETGHRDALYQLTHGPGMSWREKLHAICESLVLIASLANKIGAKLDAKSIVDQWYEGDKTKLQLLNALSGDSRDKIDQNNVDRILEICPGVSTMLNALYEYVLGMVGAQLQRVRAGKASAIEILPSAFGDLMHCIYAPYMDVFRCDSPFGALLKKNTAIRHRIFPKRSDLLTLVSSP